MTDMLLFGAIVASWIVGPVVVVLGIERALTWYRKTFL